MLQTRGEYQVKPPLPFVPGSEVGGVVRSAPDGAAVAAGRPGGRVLHAGRLRRGRGRAGVLLPSSCPTSSTSPRAPRLVLNYHTAYFALPRAGGWPRARRCSCTAPPAASGTATLQVAKGLGARTIAVVSTDEKERVAREAGADEVVRSDGPWKDQAKEISGGGVDVVVDPVGGDRFTDSLRSLREGGRVVVVGFTGGSIPEVRVNRLLLNNTEVVGAGWGAYVHVQARRGARDRRGDRRADRRRVRARRWSARASRSSAPPTR